MAGGGNQQAKKAAYFEKLKALLAEYSKILIVGADNVGSHLMQRIRHALRGQAVILMGKNTMIRKVLRELVEAQPGRYESLLALVRFNVGFVFTKGDLNYVRSKLLEFRVGAPAKAGIIAPNDVIVPKGPTGMEPTQTSFLQALNIASKINRGQVEIINDVFLIKKGDKVGSSEATLLAKLSIRPFSYGLQVLQVYDNGHVYDPAVLDLTDADLLNKFTDGLNRVASLSLEIGFPTLASLPHSLANAYKNVLAVSVETDYTFPAAKSIKDYIANPTAHAVAAAPAPAAAASVAAAPAAKVEEKKEEEDEDDDMFGGGGLFGDD
jgi:large subunit ribosomal protein LP0